MRCPTCSHTMQGLTTYPEPVFWCPRCGTIRRVAYATADGQEVGRQEDERPKLVDRVRRYMAEIGAGGPGGLFDQLGIREAIYPPGDRPTA